MNSSDDPEDILPLLLAGSCRRLSLKKNVLIYCYRIANRKLQYILLFQYVIVLIFVLFTLFLGFYESSFVSVREMPFKYEYNLKDLSSLKTCGICGRNFTKTSHLNRHMFIHTGEKPFKCSVCNMSFSKKDNLTRHNLIHTGEKPHTCFICGKTYARKDKYQEHLRSHSMVN